MRLGAARGALVLTFVGLAGRVGAQEPIFVTPPVTMYQFGAVAGVDVESRRGAVAASSEAAFGVLAPWTVSLHAVGIDARGEPAQLARLHVGTRVRLVKVDRPREWLLLSVYGAAALPLGAEADAVAEAHQVPAAVVGVSATRMARGGDAFANLSLARIPTPAGTLTGGTLGLAVGWRPRPGRYGALETQLFAEALGNYVEGGSASVALAPGVLVHSRNVVVKAGVLLPVWTRRSGDDPVLASGRSSCTSVPGALKGNVELVLGPRLGVTAGGHGRLGPPRAFA